MRSKRERGRLYALPALLALIEIELLAQ
jgi:hypothetical protein